MNLTKKEWLVLGGIFILFLALRLPALSSPYHQDEYKWPIIVNPALTLPGGIPHPPVGEFIYRELGKVVGYDNFRVIPFMFSIANFFLLFYLVKTIFDKRTAFWSVGLFSIIYYSVLASVMVDTDGSIMPFFALLSLIGYYQLRIANYELLGKNWRWLALLAAGVVLGFLTKVSFLLVLVALLVDFAFEKQVFSDKRRLFKWLVYSLGGALVLVGILLASKIIFPSFNFQSSIKYWEHFAVFSGRGWLQTFIQFAKAVMYLSPLSVLPTLFIDREIFHKTRPLLFFSVFGLLFYLAVFDFSLGALDRYFQFLVVPLSVLAGAVFAKVWSSNADTICKPDVIAVSIVSLGVFALQLFEQFVPPLYPKTEWLSRLVSFKWNFLFPFTGGSGPLPFYVSFQFIALLWVVSIIFIILVLMNREVVKRSLFAVLVFGLLYNTVFTEEYLFGRINGSSRGLVKGAVEFIKNREEIKSVAVYNDNGGYEIQEIGKYARRIYATPQFEATYRDYLKTFSGHILFVDIPRIEEGNFYSDFFRKCTPLYTETDKYISATVLDCAK